MIEKDINTINRDAYRTDDAVETYSHYNLYPNEKYLFMKYFDTGATVLDLACGAGRTTVRLHEMGYRVKGIDLSDVLIGLAKKRFPQISFEEGNYCDIREKSESFDNVLISHNGLDHAFPETDREKAISESYRVLKKGGYFIFSSHNIKSLYFSPYYLKDPARAVWMVRNIGKSLRVKEYIIDLKMYMFYSSPEYCINQVKKAGFLPEEVIGFRASHSNFFNRYFSPYIHYVFRK